MTNPKNRALRDLSVREWFVIAPVCAVAIFMGVAPGLFLSPMEPAVRRVVEHIRGNAMPMNAENASSWRRARGLAASARRRRSRGDAARAEGH